jgi:hypothetical protein
VLRFTLALLLLAQASRFSYSDIDRGASLETLARRYPHSSRVGETIYVSAEDVRDSVTLIGLSGEGTARRLRLSFESRNVKGEPLYPSCADIRRRLEMRYGKPQVVREFDEEASRRSDALWQSATEEMTLVCFTPPGRRSVRMAEAIVVAGR